MHAMVMTSLLPGESASTRGPDGDQRTRRLAQSASVVSDWYPMGIPRGSHETRSRARPVSVQSVAAAVIRATISALEGPGAGLGVVRICANRSSIRV